MAKRRLGVLPEQRRAELRYCIDQRHADALQGSAELRTSGVVPRMSGKLIMLGSCARMTCAWRMRVIQPARATASRPLA